MPLEAVLLVGALIILFVVGAVQLLRSIYHATKMMSHTKSEKHEKRAHLFPWLVPFLPYFFTEKGNYHRRVSGVSLLWSVACFLGLVVIMEFFKGSA